MLTMSYSEKSWNSSEDFEDDNSSTSSPLQRRINNGEMVEVNGNNVITTHCVSTVIKPGDKQLHDPLQFVKIKSTELSQKAKEQIKLAEEVKITKEKIKEVEEEWSSVLSSWKSKRRQNKRSSDEELQENNSINNSRKIKTFNEILNEKAKSGHRIGYNLHHYLMNENEDNLIDNHDEKYDNQDNQSIESNNNSSSDHTDHHQMNNDFTTTNNDHYINQPDNRHQSNLNSNLSNNNDNQQQNEPNNKHQNSQSIDLNRTNQSTNDEDDDESLSDVITSTSLLKEYCSNNLSQKDNAQNSAVDKRRNQSSPSQQLFNSQTLMNNSNKTINECRTNSQQSDQLTNDNSSCDGVKDESGGNKKLSFKAKLSAFENLAKNEPKKPLEKTPPVKNKLRMSSSNNLIANKRKVDEANSKQETLSGNLSKLYTSKSNENLSKLKSSHPHESVNAKINHNKRSELNSTKSESNLTSNILPHTAYRQPLNEQQFNNESNLSNQNDLLSSRSSNELLSNNKDTVHSNNNNNLQQFDCDYEVSELSKRMQHQMSTSPSNQMQQPNCLLTHSSSNLHQPHSTNLSSAASLSSSSLSTAIHQSSSSSSIHAATNQPLAHSAAIQPPQSTSHQFINSINSVEELTTTSTGNYFNDDYANHSQLYNHQLASQQHNLISSNLTPMQTSIPDAFTQANQALSYQQPVATSNSKQNSISASMLPQQTTYYDENVGLYGNYYNASNLGANAYQLQKHNRSTSSGHLEYANGLPPITNQMYYHNNSSKPIQSYSTSQLMNRQSQPQLNLVSGSAAPAAQQQQLTSQPAQSYNYNHWLIQEAELRRQIATRNGSSLIANTNPQNLPASLQQPANNLYKDDQPVYENTIIYNSHKKQQQLHQQMSANNLSTGYMSNSQPQINKPLYPNPSMINNQTAAPLQQTNNQLNQQQSNYLPSQQKQQQNKQILSVSGKKKCSNCGDELGRGCAAMVIETLSLYYHINCFRCSVCHIILGNCTCGTDVRVRNHKLHCSNCYSNEETGLKFSRV